MGPARGHRVRRWREAELRQHLEAARFPLAELVIRGQGFKDGGPDMRAFRAAVLGDHVRPATTPQPLRTTLVG